MAVPLRAARHVRTAGGNLGFGLIGSQGVWDPDWDFLAVSQACSGV